MTSIVIKTVVLGGKTFRYLIYLNKKPTQRFPMCKFPREKVPAGTYRPFMYIKGDQQIGYQKIEFPESLWGTMVTVDDPIEMELIELKNNYPDFDYIKIEEIDIK
jgi:hypothetical protein